MQLDTISTSRLNTIINALPAAYCNAIRAQNQGKKADYKMRADFYNQLAAELREFGLAIDTLK